MESFGVSPAKLRTTINGVDCNHFSPLEGNGQAILRKDLNLPEDAFLLGILGRFGPFKRHTMLLKAFEILAESRPDLHLLVVGDNGSERDKVLGLIESSQYRDRITWAGFQIDPVPLPSSDGSPRNPIRQRRTVQCHARIHGLRGAPP